MKFLNDSNSYKDDNWQVKNYHMKNHQVIMITSSMAVPGVNDDS